MDQMHTTPARILHPTYGDLSKPDCIQIPQNRIHAFPKENTPLYIHLTVTLKCTARCKGCINHCVTFTESAPNETSDAIPQRDARAILNLIEKDNAKEVAICFYGGEPLLSPEIIKETIKILNAQKPLNCTIRYMIYTNGMTIKNALRHSTLLADQVWLYSISIDGRQDQHNAARLGTSYNQIAANLQYLKDHSNGTQKLMWTTLREEQSLRDAFDAFTSLHKDQLINHFFWHFVETDDPFENLPQFALQYETDLKYILETYLCELRQNKRLLSILHLNELILYLLCSKDRNSTACGVELSSNYDIVSGHIQTCADLPPEYTLGTINPDGSLDINDQDLSHLVTYKNDLGCHTCGIHPYCGGRCPVQALTCSTDRVKQYCQLMRLHVATTMHYLPEIETELNNAGFSHQDLYDQSAFYVQFTDVTP